MEETGSPSHGEWTRLLGDDGPGGRAAREQLRSALLSGVRRIFGRRGMGEDFCEDIVQETLIRVREKVGEFRGESRIETWALAIATRLGFDELRHRRWKDVPLEQLVAEGSEAVLAEPEQAPGTERGLLRARALAALRTAIETQLTDRQRQALLAELEGMPQAEIATRLGTNRNALYKLSHDARRKLKAQLEASGLAAADVRWAFE